MSDLRDLYQQAILDHSKRPRNFRKPDAYTHMAQGHNPLCGDQVLIFADVEDGTIKDVGFQGKGCAICMASTSVMTETVKGRPLDEAEGLYEKFHHLLTDSGGKVPDEGPELGKLELFAGVREFPVRVKCATLPWHTLHAALQGAGEVSTE